MTYIATSDVPLSYVFLPVVRKSETAAEAEGCMLAEVLAPRPFELHFVNLRIEKMMMWGTFGMWYDDDSGEIHGRGVNVN